VLQSFEDSKERLSEGQQHALHRLTKLKLCLKVLIVFVATSNVYMHLRSDSVNRWLIRQKLVPLSSFL